MHISRWKNISHKTEKRAGEKQKYISIQNCDLSHKTAKKNSNKVAAQYLAQAAHRARKVFTQAGQFNIKDKKDSRAEEKGN